MHRSSSAFVIITDNAFSTTCTVRRMTHFSKLTQTTKAAN